MTISFLHPAYIALLLALPVIWFMKQRSHTPAVLLRCAILLLVILGVMQPVAFLTATSHHHIIIVDQSDSMAENSSVSAVNQALEFVNTLPADTTEVIVIGNAPSDLGNLDNVLEVDANLSISHAVALALSSIPYHHSGTITLFSDGVGTDDHWSSVLAGLAQREVALNWVGYSPRPPKTAIGDLSYVPFFPGDAPVINVRLASSSDLTTSHSVRVRADQQVLLQDTIANIAGSDTTSLSVELPATKQLYQPVEVELLDPQGDIVDTKPLVLTAQHPLQVLFASHDAQNGEYLQQLVGNAFNITTLVYPWSNNQKPDGYDAIVLDDASESSLTEDVQQSIALAVENGTGLLYTGSEFAFTHNGLTQSPLESILPVNINSIESKREPGISLAIIIDSSGSMQGQPIELAKQVARLAVRKLKPQDQVGIVEFYGTRQWAVPMQPALNTEELERAIGRLQAQGGSELFPAIEEAYFGLKGSHNKYRHILLITDAAVEEENYQRLLQYIASDQINVSTVLVGDNASGEERMADLANWGEGRFYAIYNEFSMVELNFRRSDNQPASRYKTGTFPVKKTATNSPFAYPLNGYTVVPLKPGAIANWTVDGTNDAVLASWQYGAGQVMALMTEPLGNGTQNWRAWPDYGEHMASLLASLSTYANKASLTAERTFNRVQVQFESSASPISPVLQWKTAAQTQWSTMPLRMRAPGVFSSHIEVPRNQHVYMSVEDEHRVLRTALAANSDLRSEHHRETNQFGLLEQVVAQSHGHLIDAAQFDAQSVAEGRQHAIAMRLMPLAFLAALILYFIDIIYRRWPKRRQTGFPGNAV